jgi:hypothetical protein
MQAAEPKASDGPITLATARIRIMRTVITKTSARMRAKKKIAGFACVPCPVFARKDRNKAAIHLLKFAAAPKSGKRVISLH